MKTNKLLYGVGVYSRGKYACSINNKRTKEYQLWSGMIRRCYPYKTQDKSKTYQDCTVSENFKNFQFFAEWCNQQIGFNLHGWELDKDILVRDNKVYSEDTCCFVPRDLNALLVKRNKSRGKLKIGVCWCTTHEKFVASCGMRGKYKRIGYYSTELEAYLAYKRFKESYVKSQTEIYRDQLDPRTYQALLKWESNIND